MKNIFLIFFIFLNLNAHNLKIFTTKEKNVLHVKSYFNAKSPCIKCEVLVQTAKSKTDFIYKTNEQGIALIPLNLNPTKITVIADLGHKNSIEIIPQLKEESTDLPYPFWLKIVFSLLMISLFFAVFKRFKKI